MAIRLTDVYNRYVERFSDRIANTNFSTIRLRPIYNRYSERFPNRVSGIVDFIPNTYAIGFTPKLQVGSPTQFQINSKSFFDIRSRNIAVTSGVTHTNYNDGSFVKSFNARLYSPEKRYSDSVNLTDVNTSPIGKYAITERSKSPLMRQYAKFNLRKDSTGNLEPFILRGIQRNGKNQEPQRWGGILSAVGIAVTADRAVTDLLRLGKFALSRNGIKYRINKRILRKYEITRPYESELNKTPEQLLRNFSPFGTYNNKQLKDFIPPIPGVGILYTGKSGNYAESDSNVGEGPPKIAKTVRSYLEDSGIINKIYRETDEVVGSNTDTNLNEEAYKKEIREYGLIPIGFNRLDGPKIIFPGTLSNMSDTFTPNWESYQYIGRPDKVYNYQGLDRSISFSFQVYAHSKSELRQMYKKLDKLAKMTMPKINIFNSRMSGPLVKLTIGDLYQEQLGFINSLNIAPSTEVPFDLNIRDDTAGLTFSKAVEYVKRTGKLATPLLDVEDPDAPKGGALPILADISVGFTMIHDTIPGANTGFISFVDSDYIYPQGTVKVGPLSNEGVVP